jgi:hypothetical protein
VESHIKEKIKNFKTNFYDKFSEKDRNRFKEILSSINNPNKTHDLFAVIDILDYQLMGIKIIKEEGTTKCMIQSVYPNLIELYYSKIDGLNYKIITASKLRDTLRYINGHDYQMVGNMFEKAIESYLSSFVFSEDDVIPGSQCEINMLNDTHIIDKFDIFNLKVNNPRHFIDQIKLGVFFTNKTENHKYIDGGFISFKYGDDRSGNVDLCTYDVTISDKSNEMREKIENIDRDLDSFRNTIRNLFKNHKRNIKINFVKHFYIVGVGSDDSFALNNELTPQLKELNQKHSKRILNYKDSLESGDLKNKIGILSAKITSGKSDSGQSGELSLKLEEIKL